jgi:hypothetical protein
MLTYPWDNVWQGNFMDRGFVFATSPLGFENSFNAGSAAAEKPVRKKPAVARWIVSLAF